MLIRELNTDGTELLKDFIYEAIFVPEGEDPPDRSIIFNPEISMYYEDFGRRPGDHCIVADDGGRIVGAVWTRLMHDYGYVDDETPSLAISLYREYRGNGIGTEMMRRMLELLKQQGYRKVSLSCQKANKAVDLYRRYGFMVHEDKDDEFIMVREL
ncbi:MAG: GNAT family N-acetyltransferase [Spirochaetales bacterium]|nr:GNAT family N-acetyltransferase [Spirochaetales bacterium]